MMSRLTQKLKDIMLSQIHAPIVICWSNMIIGYSQSGRMNEALDLFRQMSIKNVVSWNTMIC